MDLIQRNDKILLIWDASFNLESSEFNADKLKADFDASINFENIQRLSLASYADSTFTYIIVKSSEQSDVPFFASLLKLLKPSGRLLVSPKNIAPTSETLKLAGFVNISNKQNDVVAEMPNYEVGSSSKLSFAKKKTDKKSAAAVWKLDDEDDDLINEDELLDEKDKEKPNPTELRVCGTTGKRKACKDCSCGLAEELASEGKQKAATENAKSSCGSCYLGDAFRCAACPYLGMPAFKPGEKIQLAGGLLKDDL